MKYVNKKKSNNVNSEYNWFYVSCGFLAALIWITISTSNNNHLKLVNEQLEYYTIETENKLNANYQDFITQKIKYTKEIDSLKHIIKSYQPIVKKNKVFVKKTIIDTTIKILPIIIKDSI